MATMGFDDSLLTGRDPRLYVGEVTPGVSDLTPGAYTYEVQTVTTSAATAITGGAFTLTFEGYTATFNYDYTGEQARLALEALQSIHTVDVTVVPNPATTGGRVWTITFTHLRDEVVQGAGNLFLLTAVATGLTATEPKVVVAEKIKGTDPMRLSLTGLTPCVRYYLRTSVSNAAGFSSLSPVISAVPRSQPDTPAAPSLTIWPSGTDVTIRWSAPSTCSRLLLLLLLLPLPLASSGPPPGLGLMKATATLAAPAPMS